MTKTITCCDGCGCESSAVNPVKTYKTIAYRKFDSTEGRPLDKEYVSQIVVDLCEKCARKATNVEDTSCMGISSLSIRIDDIKRNR